MKVRESDTVWHRFTLTLRTHRAGPTDGSPPRPVTIPLLVTHTGGAGQEDHTAIPMSVTFAARQSTTSFSMRAIPDRTKETGEGLRLDFGALPAGIIRSHWGPYETIEFLDEYLPDLTVRFGAEAYTAREGGPAARVSIHLSEPVDVEPLDVRLQLRYGGDATAADHGSIPTVVRFAVGERTKTIMVTATDDSDDDDGESVSLSFVNAPNDRLIAGNATTSDYSVQANVTFGPNETSKTVTVTATDDPESDGGESVRIGFGALPDGVLAAARRRWW